MSTAKSSGASAIPGLSDLTCYDPLVGALPLTANTRFRPIPAKGTVLPRFRVVLPSGIKSPQHKHWTIPQFRESGLPMQDQGGDRRGSNPRPSEPQSADTGCQALLYVAESANSR